MTDDWNAVRFLVQFRVDQERGERRTLAEYLDIFAGDETLIANEFLAAQRSRADSETETETADLGPYQLGREIGRGAQGVVYAARHRRLGRDVAIKLIPRSATTSDAAALRLWKEAVTVSRLDHPGLCKIYDVGLWRGQPYFAMQLVDRGTLADHLRECRARHALTPVDRAIEIVRAVADAVHAAHEAGIIHRDLKPANIALASEGRPIVLDFGLLLDHDSALPHIAEAPSCGTLEYMAPEQILAAEIDRRADIWALGVILCELLTGVRPFTGSTRAAVHEAMLADPLPVGLGQRRGVSRDLRAVLGTALARDPSERYQTAADLRDDLERVTRNVPARASRSGAGIAAWRWMQRNRALTAAMLVTVVLSAAGLWAATSARAQRLELATTAEAQAAAVRDQVDDLLQRMDRALQDLPESTVARRDLLETVQDWLVELAQHDAGNVETAERLAITHVKLGDVLGHPGTRNLGQIEEALESYGRAIEIASQHPDSPLLQRAGAVAHGRRGTVLLSGGTVFAAERDLTRALELYEDLPPDESRLGILQEQMMAIGHLARAHEYRQDWTGALSLWDRAIVKARAVMEETGSGRSDRGRLEFVRSSRALVLIRLDRDDEALVALTSAAENLEALLERSQDAETCVWSALSIAWRGVGEAAEKCGETETATAAFDRCVHWRRFAYDRDSTDVTAALSYASGLRIRYAHLSDSSAPPPPSDLGLAEEILATVLDQHPGHRSANANWVRLQREFGKLHRQRGEEQLANERLSRALETARALAAEDPDNLDTAELVASCELELGAHAGPRQQ